MLSYVLIGLSLVLLGIVGFQFTYMFYLDRVHLERRKHIHTLEKKCLDLTGRLDAAESQVAELDALLDQAGLKSDCDVWAEVLEDA